MKRFLSLIIIATLIFGHIAQAQQEIINGRGENYYYSEWYDECPAFNERANVLDLYTHREDDTTEWFAKQEYTSSRIALHGLVALVYWGLTQTTTPYFYLSENKMPEYLRVYQYTEAITDGPVNSAAMLLLDSVRWDTAAPKLLRLPTSALPGQDTTFAIVYAYEAYFPAPVYVDSTFFIAGSFKSNQLVYDPKFGPLYYPNKPTIYAGIYARQHPSNPYCHNRYPHYLHLGPAFSPFWHDYSCSNGNIVEYGYFLPIVENHRLEVFTEDTLKGDALGSGWCPDSSIQTISAVAHYGYRFSHWNDGDSALPRSLQITQDTAFTAFFTPHPWHHVSVHSNDSTWGLGFGSGDYAQGASVMIDARPNSIYYKFSHWSDGNTDNPRTFILENDTAFTAVFVEKPYYNMLARSFDDSYGYVTGSGNYLENTVATIQAVPADFQHFRKWNDGNTDNPREVLMTQDTTFTAIFRLADSFHVTVLMNEPDRGTTEGSGTYTIVHTNPPTGTEVTISATPLNYFYTFYSWTDGCTDNPRTFTLVRDTTFTAFIGYSEMNRLILLSNNEAWGTVEGGGGEYYTLQPVTVRALPRYGYQFLHWDDGNTDNPREYLLQQHLDTLIAIFGPLNGIEEVSDEEEMLKVFPNPTHNLMTLELAWDGGYDLALFDVAGRKVMEQHCYNRRHTLSLDNLPAGHYTLRVTAAERTWVRNVIKQ
ncbi:MAG: T9SS type A sorting domain-containing protein [Bacteroidales bacterium]|nr:T9SS type A sorting domain-containing protein [Bacteroidales bacterium]